MAGADAEAEAGGSTRIAVPLTILAVEAGPGVEGIEAVATTLANRGVAMVAVAEVEAVGISQVRSDVLRVCVSIPWCS